MLMARVCRRVWQHTHTCVRNLWGVKLSKHWSDPRRLANERGNGGPSLISRRDNGSNWHQAETFQSLASASRQTKGVTLLWSPLLFSPLPYYCGRSVTSSVTGRPSALSLRCKFSTRGGRNPKDQSNQSKIYMVLIPTCNRLIMML